MGTRRHLREAFFRDHPFCCFCGGTAPAVEEDHIPARHLFRGRAWPEGYVFPACAACNDASTLDELVLGWLVRIQVSDYSPEDEKEMTEALFKVNRRRPEWVRQMREASRIETRRHMREMGFSTTSFFGQEVYMVTMPDEFIEAITRYAEKLGKALYYFHTGKIVPTGGFVQVKSFTNCEFSSPHFPLEKFKILSVRPPMTRARKDLSDQFAYRCAVTEEDGGGAAFLVQFRQGLAMAIFVFADKSAYLKRKIAKEALAAELGSSMEAAK